MHRSTLAAKLTALSIGANSARSASRRARSGRARSDSSPRRRRSKRKRQTGTEAAAALPVVTPLRLRVESDWNVPSAGAPGAPASESAAAASSTAAAAAPGGAAALSGTISASATKGRLERALRCSAATTSGYLLVMSSSLREKMRTLPHGARWSCARCPSYLCSAAKAAGPPPGPRRSLSASAMEEQGLASMGCDGTPGASEHAAESAPRKAASGSGARGASASRSASTRTPTSGRSEYAPRMASCMRWTAAAGGSGAAASACACIRLAAASAGRTDASREMPHAMWGTKVRTSHLISLPAAARSMWLSLVAFAFSTPAPPSVARPRSFSRMPRAELGTGLFRNVWRPLPACPSRTASAASPESRSFAYAAEYSARGALVASRMALVIAPCDRPSGRASVDQSGRRRCPPDCASLAGLSR
mmetsp:Transcript_3179/g.9147  ORF Transcript_3179/g.9147 Transcript_3179/m.9147 type:complete len:421 (-) Transcript_3179:394-1656(-)